MNLAMYAKRNTFSVTPPPPPPPKKKNKRNSPWYLFSSCPYKVFWLCFRTWGLGGQNFQEVRHLEDRLPDYQKLLHQRDPSQPLTACQQWKHLQTSPISKRFTSRDTKHLEGEHPGRTLNIPRMRRPMIVATRAARRETPTKIPVPHVSTPTRRCKKRRDEITDSEKDETGSMLNEIVGVMKDSAHDLVARSQSLAHDSSSGEGQLLPVDAWIHKQNTTTQLPWFPEASLQVGIRLHHIRLSPGPPCKLDHGYRRRLPPLHRRLITLNLNSTLCTPPPPRKTSASHWYWIPGVAAFPA